MGISLAFLVDDSHGHALKVRQYNKTCVSWKESEKTRDLFSLNNRSGTCVLPALVYIFGQSLATSLYSSEIESELKNLI